MNPIELRKHRQLQLLNVLSQNLFDGDVDNLMSLVNTKALERYLEFTSTTVGDVLHQCVSNKAMSSAVAFAICKKASRQGVEDEKAVFDYINSKTKSSVVSNLSVNAKRYAGIDKSVDGEITGSVNGDIFAKIIVGKGGHQDNVWIELNSIINQVKTLPNDRVYCLLVDTDDEKKFLNLKQKETNNVWVCNTTQLIEKLN